MHYVIEPINEHAEVEFDAQAFYKAIWQKVQEVAPNSETIRFVSGHNKIYHMITRAQFLLMLKQSQTKSTDEVQPKFQAISSI